MSIKKRTYINSDEELVVQGKLTVEGEFVQRDITIVESQTLLEGDSLTINSDADSNTAKLVLQGANSNAIISYTDGGSIDFSEAIAVSGDIEANIVGDVTGTVTGQVTDISNHTTTDLLEGTNLYFTAQRVRSNISGGTGVVYNSSTGEISIGQNVGTDANVQFDTIVANSISIGTASASDIEANVIGHVKADNGTVILSNGTDGTDAEFTGNVIGAVTGDVTGNVTGTVTGQVTDISNHSTTDLSEGANLYYTTERVRSNVSASGDISYDSANGVFSVTTYKSSDFDTDFADKTTDDLSEGNANLYFTTSRIDSHLVGGVDAQIFVDGNYANKPNIRWDATGQTWEFSNDGVNYFLMPTSTDDLAEGNANLYYTDARANAAMDAYLTSITANVDSVNGETGVVTLDTDNILEGVSNLYYTDQRVENYISGGDGVDFANGVISVDNTVVRTTGDQSLANTKTFTGELVIPNTGATSNGAIFYDSANSQAFIRINDTNLEITPASLVGDVEDVGAAGINLYAGSREVPGSSASVTQSLIAAKVGISANIVVDGNITGFSSIFDTSNIVVGNSFVTPANVSYAELSVMLEQQGDSNGQRITLQVYKNGSLLYQQVDDRDEPGIPYGDTYFTTGPIQTTPGDIFNFAVSGLDTQDQAGGKGIQTTYTYLSYQALLSTPSVEASKIHGIKSIAAGSYLDISEASNVITVDANISSIREQFDSATSGLGSLSYNNSTGVFTYAGPSQSTIRGLLSGAGLINYNSTTGEISTTADNYSSWNIATESNVDHSVTSGETLTIQGGTNITVTNVGNVVTIANDNDADITAVIAGTGLTGGGVAGNVTLNVDMTAFDTDDLSEGNTNLYYTDDRVRDSVSASGDLLYSNATGVFSVTTYKSTDFDTDFSGKTTTDLTEGTNQYYTDSRARDSVSLTQTPPANGNVFAVANISYSNSTGVFDTTTISESDVRDLFSATSPLSYDANTGEFSVTEIGDISSVTAGNGLVGGGTSGAVTLDIGAGTGVISDADNISVDMSAFSTDDLPEGANLYHTDTRTRNAVSADTSTGVDYNVSTGQFFLSSVPNDSISNSSITVNGVEFDLGDTNTITANTTETLTRGTYLTGSDFNGDTATTWAVDATSSSEANKVVVRDVNGSFAANVVTATATQAQYADLAENYLADREYEPGTVLIIGGDAEVTTTDVHCDTRVAGVVSTDPAHLMNSKLKGKKVVALALRGRVPVKVQGPVHKGEVLVTCERSGYACVAQDPTSVPACAIIGKALTSHASSGSGVVEVMV